MNKNTIFAFLIILGSVMFFTSQTYNKFYTEKILKKEYKKVEKITNNNKNELKEEIKNELKEESVKNSEIKDVTVIDTIWLENEYLKIGIEDVGAAIVSIIEKKYKKENNNEMINLIKGERGALVKIGDIDYSNIRFKNKGRIQSQKNEGIILKSESEDSLEKIITLNKDSYEIGIELRKRDLPGDKITFSWNPGIIESEDNTTKNRILKKVLHIKSNGTQSMVMKKNEKEGPFSGSYKWIGITTKYFLIAINNVDNFESDIKIETKEISKNEINYSTEITRMAEKSSEKFQIYAGPKDRSELKKYNKNYESVLFPVTGWTKYFIFADKWFPWLADKVLLLLLLIQKFVKDYGVAILIITLLSKIITYPMTVSSMKSMEKMKDIQPKVNKIREKHKNNAQKMNEEIMNLYKKEGVNPLNPGCLPMFLQAPIFISLYVVLQYAVEIRGTKTFLIPWITDLSKPEVLLSIKNILPNGIPMYGTNIALLPIIMALLTYFQQKLTIKDPNQKMLIYFMPIFMLVLFNSFPSGLVLYWTFSNAIQLGQQLLLNKKK